MTRTVSSPPVPRRVSLDEVNHLVLHDVSWDFYERLLDEIGDRPIRVAYDEGVIEIMSPLFEHENPGRFICRMIETQSLLRGMRITSGGSTTFRRADLLKGAEPDGCYFIKSAAAMRGKKGRWNPKKDPPPDLVVEVDVTSASIPREPIYAALKVPELWRWDGKRIVCRALKAGRYETVARSLAFPFLEVARLKRYLDDLPKRDENEVLRAFMEWANAIP